MSNDKRVPAELLAKAVKFLQVASHGSGFLYSVQVAHALEACPDIVDEGATMHRTAQAVLDAVDNWFTGEEEESPWDAWQKWNAAGRPTVVPAEEDEPAHGARRQGESWEDYVDRMEREAPAVEDDHTVTESAWLKGWSAAMHVKGCDAIIESRCLDPEDAATLAAMNECRELGLEVLYVPTKPTPWRVRHEVKRGKWTFGETATEALAAYKAEQAPKVEDGTYWVRINDWFDDDWHQREIKDGRVVGCRENLGEDLKAQQPRVEVGPMIPKKPARDD